MPDKLEERLRRQMEADGLSLRHASRKIGVGFTTIGRILRGGEPYPRTRKKVERWLSKRARPQPADEITRLKGEVERLSAEVAAWGNIASGLRAYLEDRRNEGDHITPEKVLSILEGDIRIMEERSRKIYAATQYRSQAAEAALAAKQALIDEAVGVLEPFKRAATAFGDDPGPIRFYTDTGYREIPLEDFRRARALISKARSSGKAGSDA